DRRHGAAHRLRAVGPGLRPRRRGRGRAGISRRRVRRGVNLDRHRADARGRRGGPRWPMGALAAMDPLACGVAVFVIVLPGVFGPFLAGRLAITVWMLGWAALGAALVKNARDG